jgi:hypothetical protein
MGLLTLNDYINDGRDNAQPQSFVGFAARVRVQSVCKGPKKINIMLYFDKIKDLDWDPARFRWPQVLGKQQPTEFLQYNTKIGKGILKKRQLPLMLTQTKWRNILPHNF